MRAHGSVKWADWALRSKMVSSSLSTSSSSTVKKVLLVQPSSAAAERVFSILNLSFNNLQDHALVDYLQAIVNNASI